MSGVMTIPQVHQVLYLQMFGRLACRDTKDKDKLYVVPVSYAFDGKFLYAHSREGKKIDMLRNNTNVCFQVDIVDSLADWRSVLIWGKYQELKTAREQADAAQLLNDRFGPLHLSQSISQPSAGVRPPESVEKKRKAVYFRLTLDEVSGRYEKRS